LAALGVGFALALCDCPATTQKAIYDGADLVAKVRFNHLSLDGGTMLIYNTTFLEVFKPRDNSSKPTGFITANATTPNCNAVTFIMLHEDYLIAANQSGKNYQLNSCQGFPQHPQGRPILATPWELVTNETLSNLLRGSF